MKKIYNQKIYNEVAIKLKDHLTFYHEYLVPENDFFRSESNNDNETNMLIVSSPSRMGNHLLHSMLDGHKDIPRVPGEDGVLFHAFKFSNNSFYEFIQNLRSDSCVDQLERYAATGGKDRKWKVFKECFEKGLIPEIYSGIQVPTTAFYVTDYQGVLFDIDYSSYHNNLIENVENINTSRSLKDVINIYYKSLNLLDYKYRHKTKYDIQVVASGMRVMSKWALQHYKNAILVCSIRKFESYAISHVRSRYKQDAFSKENMREAWEMWFHKIIDYVYLKLVFGERVIMVNFDDIITDTENTAKYICNKLDIEYDVCMLTPSAFGNPTKGNSSVIKNNDQLGKFYKRPETIDEKLIPDEYHDIWSEVKKLFNI